MALAGFFEPRLIGRTIILILPAATPEVEPIFGPLFIAPSRESEPALKTEFSGFSRVDEKKNHEQPA